MTRRLPRSLDDTIVTAVALWWARAGYSCTIRDLSAMVDAAPSSVHRALTRLVATGRIEYTPRIARSIRPGRQDEQG